MEHHFNIQIAKKYGVNEAIFLNNIAYWILYNKAHSKNFHDGRYWTFNTAKAFRLIFSYWSIQNQRTIIKSCIDQGLIMIGNYNKRKSDRTLWYALTDLGLNLFPTIGSFEPDLDNEPDHLLELTNEVSSGLQGIEPSQTRIESHLLDSTNPFVRINTALPDNKQDIKTKDKRYCSSDDERASFEQFWEVYPKKQKKASAMKIWTKQNLHEKAQEIITHIQKRKISEWKGKEAQFIPLPDTFLNQQRWNDEIITSSNLILVKNDTRSTVPSWGPGHPDYDRINQKSSS